MSGSPPEWLRWHSFSAPRRGNVSEENDDALAGDLAQARFALADGAAEAIGANLWARILVASFVQAPIQRAQDLDRWVAALQSRWWEEIQGKRLPWYAEAKLDEGAFAAFVGLVLHPDHTWQAVAVGDSCLFQVRDGQLLTTFPLESLGEFGIKPWLIGSNDPTGIIAEQSKGREIQGRWAGGDTFLLMSDALAEWFWRRTQQCGQPPLLSVNQLLGLAARPTDLAEALADLQSQEGLHNDDSTLIAVTCC